MSDEREDVLLLDVPQEGDYLSVLPTATAAVATRLGFSLDEIEDLRAAVNAAVGLLLPPDSARPRLLRGRTPPEPLRCRLEVGETCLQIVLSRPKGDPLPGDNTYQWQVLRALTDEVRSETAGSVSTISIRQRRPSTESDADTERHSLH
ncbi:anti-sigma regulatory factor [Glycomyces buryatensis]|uniref:Anti-sigma regulatory factor n=1 Tax=Glycomyces buryatensis TaxID=2570927 RepID=A0A4S8PW09_9ACTN|nr:anti-sigma regulatory factor [Glycomyces buryatensis]THV35770.1 anti-sigma regulatory factor [Glycomyces buryatensis]